MINNFQHLILQILVFFFLINGLTRQALQNTMIFRIIYHDKDPFLLMLMIIQNLIMSIFCTIDKTMVTENLQKIQKTRKRFFFAIFYEYSSYKTYLTEELIYRYYYTKLSYIAFIFYLFLTSHVSSHALWLQWTIWYSD